MELRLDYRPGLFDEESARGLLDRLVEASWPSSPPIPGSGRARWSC
ncbi:hypothetical protein SFUMM280S_02778 [Streptomyces fumanus]